MNYTIRPLGPWLEPVTKARRGSHIFSASWPSTLDLLERELGYLDGRQVVMQIDVTEADLRLDGMIRANAKVGFPGVRIRFESKHGPLTYATDAYERQYGWSKLDGWQANIRAIALGLESLRAVDRYGVTKRGEQYTGWKQLPSGIVTPKPMTVEDAARFIATAARYEDLVDLSNPTYALNWYRDAARNLHPDQGGDTEEFQRLQQAKAILEAAGG